MEYKVTEKGLNRISSHLKNVFNDQYLPLIEDKIISEAQAKYAQSAEQAMIERLRNGMKTAFDIEFYLHELKESTIFKSGNLPSAHKRALEWRRLRKDIDLFHPDVVKIFSDIFY